MSQDTSTAANDLGWDPTDPHGINPHDEAHEGHFVADWRMQVSILVILLFFTALTVGFYNLEQWVETAFEITLPRWINIAGAMSIATIKALLVAAFFMQLKYDKALNTFVMLFCLFCVALFLTFSMIDLKSRDWVYAEKAPALIEGGTGVGLNAASADKDFSLAVGPKVNTAGQNIVGYARLKGIEEYLAEGKTEADFWAHFYDGHAVHRDEYDEKDYFTQLGLGHHDQVSTANASHPRHGLTPGLFSDVEPSHTTDHASESNDASHGEADKADDGH
jgi:cytochrome c oxidase subunit IV